MPLEILDRFLPLSARQDPNRAKGARVVVAVCLVGVILEPIMSLRHFLLSHNTLAGALTLGVAFIGVALLVLVRRGAAIHVVMDVIGGLVVGMGAAVSLVRGGFYISTLIGATLVPLGVGLFRPPRATLAWAVVSGASLTLVTFVTLFGPATMKRETAFDAGPLFVFLVIATVIALVHERTRRALEADKESLRRRIELAERLESLGHLAAGVAHDFNNLLTVFRAAGETLVDALPAHDPLRVEAEAVRDAADRGSTIARQLLAFSRPGTPGTETFDVVVAVRAMHPLLVRALPDDIVLELDLPAGKLTVNGDARALLNVVLNLVVNARDAMPRGGRVTIRLLETELAEGEAVAAALQRGRYATIDVVDEGTGIPSEVLPHVFAPYFTTKTRERGSGLGLASAYGVIRGLRGEIRVLATAPGRGTTLRILLPIVDDDAVAPRKDASDRPLAAGPIVVLVVDDQPELAAAARRLLGPLFGSVIATSGAEAIATFHARADVDVVLTDVSMPGMSGVELAAELRKGVPRLPIVYMTGYSDDPLIDEEVAAGVARLVRKPFDRATLRREIESAVGSQPARSASVDGVPMDRRPRTA